MYMITIKDAGKHRTCNCCESDQDVSAIMFSDVRKCQGIEVAICADCMSRLAKMLKQKDAVPYTKDEIVLIDSCYIPDTLYIEERGEDYTYPVLYSTCRNGFLYAANLAGEFALDFFDYGKKWRCWPAEPDKKKRMATEWECDDT